MNLVRVQKPGIVIFGLAFVGAVLAVSMLVSQSVGFLLAALGLLFVLVFLNVQLVLLLVIAALLAGQLLRVFPLGVSGAILLADLMMVALAGAWWLKQLAGRHQTFKTPLNVPIIFWLALMLFSLISAAGALTGTELLVSFSFVLRWAAYLSLFYILADLFWKKPGLKKVYLNGVVIFGVVLSLLGFVQLAVFPDLLFLERFGWDPHSYRLVSTFLDPNLLGGLLIIVLSLAVSKLWFAQDRRERFWLGLAVVILLMAILLTFSRSAWLALGVGFLVFAWLQARWLILVGLVLGILMLTFPRVQERALGALRLDPSAQLRLESWQNGLEIFEANPVIGVGAGTLGFTRTRYTKDQDHLGRAASGLDSSLLTVGATTGVLGLIAYLVLWGHVLLLSWQRFKSSVRFERVVALGTLVGFMAILVHSFFVNSLFYPPVMALTWFIIAMLVNGEEARV